MRPHEFSHFGDAIQQASYQFQYRSKLVHSARWQGVDIASKPEMATHEITNCVFAVDLRSYWSEPLTGLAADIKPNLPWADAHFEERVSGTPMNPGTEWANWPYGKSAATFLQDGKFNHNYMERYWPKQAGRPKEPTFDADDWVQKFEAEQQAPVDLILPNSGINHMLYGDLNDVVQLLAKDPYTRQAYLPVWFPEDTGGGAKRAPCTIGYQFLMREEQLSVRYEIRSCDFVRHFRDDCYLTMRLLLWVLDRCREIDDRWQDVRLGKYTMSIGSFHIFRNDYQMLFGNGK